jgi:ApaG protein
MARPGWVGPGCIHKLDRHTMSRYQIQVEVTPTYLPQQSSPEEGLYVFAYTIQIRNTGTVASQLIARTWHINDAEGLHEKVRGLGVVGRQPLLQPGEHFEYTSGTRLRTPTGTMHGSYFFVAEDGERFDVDIPMFVLDALSGQDRKLH